MKGRAASRGVLSDASNAQRSVEQIYQKKTQLEHILLRPDTYIGSTEKINQHMWVYDRESDKIVWRNIGFVPGLYKIFDEILVNAADNKQRDPTMDTIRIDIDAKSNTIRVWNNGRGIPVVVHKEEGVYVPELIFGHLLTSSNYDDSQRKVTGGRNGYGAKLANIFSTDFVVETHDSGTGLHYRQRFRNNMTVKEEPAIEEDDGDDFTSITFKPDLKRFHMASLGDDLVSLLTKRAYDMAGVTPDDVAVYLNGRRIAIRGFEEYSALYMHGEGESLAAFGSFGARWQVGVGMTDGQFKQVSFVNSICTSRGGQHVQHVQDQITAHLHKAVNRGRSKGMEIKPYHISSYLSVFVNSLIENPAFDSQTKDTLTTRPSDFGSKCELPAAFLKQIAQSGIVDRVKRWAQFRQNEQLKRKGGTKKSTLVGVPKLDDANQAGTRNSDKCTLVLTEGDSAKSLAISGLSVVGRDYYGVFPLRGKLLNVREAAHAQIMANEEIQNIVKILGLKFGEEYADTRGLRYGSLLIMADQDHDGSHIKGLVINFLHHFWPSLLRVPGFLKEFITPIVKATKGRRTVEFFTLPEYQAWVEATNGARGWRVKYYKGLGTSTPAEARDYFSDLEKHVIPFTWRGDEDGSCIELAFAKKKVAERKAWLRQLQSGTHVDYAVDSMPYSEFVNKELILFSMADNVRSIPSVVDGLKPAQRKVLYCCFKRNLKREIKVAQLAGYVSEHSAYHHGETALANTIVGMAQTFVGSNNVNLLEPVGQFGTRLQGGADAASPRYVFTRLADVARAIFHPDDDAVLDYQVDDGERIEPKFYVPTIPLVLVNGADGIGTGWSTSVPNYNPRDVINNLRRRLQGKRMLPMRPWWRHFKGDVEPRDEHRFFVRGRVYVQGVEPDTRRGPGALDAWRRVAEAGLEDELFDFEAMQEASTTAAGRGRAGAAAKKQAQPLASWSTGRRLRITELPVRKWTDDYKRFLEGMLVGAEKAAAKAPGKAAAKKKPTGAAAAAAAAAKKKKAAAAKRKAKKGADGEEGEEGEEGAREPEKLGAEILAKLAPQGADEDVDFLVELTAEASASRELATFKQLMDKFKLEATVGTTNMHLFDADGAIVKYASPVDVMEEFFDLRMHYYGKRKAHLLARLEEEWGRIDNRVRFIEAVLDGRLQVARRKKAELVRELFESGFKMYPPAGKKAAAAAAEAAGAADADDVADVAEERLARAGDETALRARGYDYLLSMPLWSLTYEKVEQLRRELREKTDAVEGLRATAPRDMWLRDLDALDAALDDVQRADEAAYEERMAQREAYSQGKVLRKGRAGAAAGGRAKGAAAKARRKSVSGGAARRAAHNEAAAVVASEEDPYGRGPAAAEEEEEEDEDDAWGGSGSDSDSDEDFGARKRTTKKKAAPKAKAAASGPSEALVALMRPPFGRAPAVTLDAPDPQLPPEPAAGEAAGGEGAAFRAGVEVSVEDPRVAEAFGAGKGKAKGKAKGGAKRKLAPAAPAAAASAWDDDEVEALSLADRIRRKEGKIPSGGKAGLASKLASGGPRKKAVTRRAGTKKAKAAAAHSEEEEDFGELPSDGEGDAAMPTPKPRQPRARRAAAARARTRVVLSDSDGEEDGEAGEEWGAGDSGAEEEEDEEDAYEPTPKPAKGRKRAAQRASTREALERRVERARDASPQSATADDLAAELMRKAVVTPQKKKARTVAGARARKAAVKKASVVEEEEEEEEEEEDSFAFSPAAEDDEEAFSPEPKPAKKAPAKKAPAKKAPAKKAPAKKAPAKKAPAKKAPAKKAPANRKKRAAVVEDSDGEEEEAMAAVDSEEEEVSAPVAPRARTSRRAAAKKTTYRVDDEDEEDDDEEGGADAAAAESGSEVEFGADESDYSDFQ